jgi:hypothetical protein
MRTANRLGIFAALGLVATPVLANDSAPERDFLPTRSGQPATLWSGVAPMASSAVSTDRMSGTSENRVGAGSGEQPSTLWSGVIPSASSVIANQDTTSGTSQDRVGAGSGEPDQESSAGERTEARDFLPTRSGRPGTFWTGSR